MPFLFGGKNIMGWIRSGAHKLIRFKQEKTIMFFWHEIEPASFLENWKGNSLFSGLNRVSVTSRSVSYTNISS